MALMANETENRQNRLRLMSINADFLTGEIMKKKQSLDSGPKFDSHLDSFAIGPAYLDYCVKKGWLSKTGEGDAAQYELTDLGKRKLNNVSLNFDLSAIVDKGEGPKKKRKRHKK